MTCVALWSWSEARRLACMVLRGRIIRICWRLRLRRQSGSYRWTTWVCALPPTRTLSNVWSCGRSNLAVLNVFCFASPVSLFTIAMNSHNAAGDTAVQLLVRCRRFLQGKRWQHRICSRIGMPPHSWRFSRLRLYNSKAHRSFIYHRRGWVDHVPLLLPGYFID